MKKKILISGISISAIVGIFIVFLGVHSLGHSTNMSSPSMRTTTTKVHIDPAMEQTFKMLDKAHTDVCQDMGNKPAIDNYMNMLPGDATLQGSCCSPMNFNAYVGQVRGLKNYADIPQVPKDPYNISVVSAKEMLGFYDNIQLNAAQQSIYDMAQSMTADKGWCCCQCWAWYTHAGLAKYLITHNNYTAKQAVKVINLEDCCGGSS